MTLVSSALARSSAAAAIGAAVALAGLAFSSYLLYAQLVLIDAVCQWCIANDVVLSLASVAAVTRLSIVSRSEARAGIQTDSGPSHNLRQR